MSYYPPVGFSFTVAVGSTTQGVDAAFKEVRGLDSRTGVMELREGGENRFVHKLPGRVRNSNLVLTRGLMVASSGLFRWAKATLEGGLAEPIKPQSLLVSLLAPDQTPMIGWSFDRAWPVRWSVGPFDAQANKLAIETLEFAYGAVTRKLFKTQKKEGLLGS
ncbi:phage tail protein [Vannielia litorea]|uniref:phage tail protein n=1 Tax=Vannielia litorea TaxID=1217970 RepID=UPI001BCFF8E2|nr:phage tail protein [Vannielia litorea]MBS8226347.1 phage tail protein [Vannielia litorea]